MRRRCARVHTHRDDGLCAIPILIVAGLSAFPLQRQGPPGNTISPPLDHLVSGGPRQAAMCRRCTRVRLLGMSTPIPDSRWASVANVPATEAAGKTINPPSVRCGVVFRRSSITACPPSPSRRRSGARARADRALDEPLPIAPRPARRRRRARHRPSIRCRCGSRNMQHDRRL